MSNCEYCGAAITEGEKVCSRCGAPVKTAPEKFFKKKSTWIAIVSLAVAVIVMWIVYYNVLRPEIIYNKVMSGVDLDPGKTDKVAQHNEIAADKIMLSGLLDTCFDVGDKNAVLDFIDEGTHIDVTFSVVCKKNLEEVVNSKLQDSIPDFDPYDPLSGVFFLNGTVPEYMGKYSLEGVRAQDQFEELLKANPGDVINVHLIHEVQTYDTSKDFKQIMEVSNLVVSMSLTYKKELSNGEMDFPTIK